MKSAVLAVGAAIVAAGVTAAVALWKRKPKPTLRIACEASIACGKSQLARALHGASVRQNETGVEYQVVSYMENIQPEHLKLFLDDQQREAFGLQLITLQERLDTIWHTEKLPVTKPTLYFLDRSALGDLVFQHLHKLNGTISDKQAHVYYTKAKSRMLGRFLFEKLDCILYLHSTPERCLSSLKVRGDVDSDTTLEYLRMLDHLHVYGIIWLLLKYRQIKIAVADWRDFGDAKTAVDKMLGNVPFARLSHGDAAEWKTHVEQGTASWWQRQEDTKCLTPTVLVPFGECLVDLPATAVPACATRKVHTQEWKDAVMVNLAAGRHVVLVGARPECLLSTFDEAVSKLA